MLKQFSFFILFFMTLAQPSPLHLPTSLVDLRCPCAAPERKCQEKFEANDPEALQAMLKVIPSCPIGHVRCCSIQNMLLTIIDLSSSSSAKNAQGRLSNQNSQHNGVTCMAYDQCPKGNMYGMKEEHFEKFGIMSPEEVRLCHSSKGRILCISVENHPDSTTSTFPPTLPEEELPCVQPSSCSVVYGSLGSHFSRFGVQLSCPRSTHVRCVVEATSTTQQLSSEPPTTSITLNPNLFSTELTATPPATSSPPAPSASTLPPTSRPTTTKPKQDNKKQTTTIHPLFTTQGPVKGPEARVVNIIGPRPVYISYNHINGPYSGVLKNSPYGSIQSTSNIGGHKEDQVRSLLRQLEMKLKHVLRRYPEQ